ncbi:MULTISPECIES: nucleotide exchange factor GrpE [Gardnerella]|uniref:Protein GrpE n=1 Tax=Gardnerella leopoldii TaxID=2792978 RepID=A0ABX4SCA1_9BIFI|nr:nucleotide exchange factor GrpE [Gardnerella vaginalis]NSX45193.1 nucleotide exchange factor GrpE [Gardnerella vaginalis]PKZ17695.1 nucleotide exchange factor GrpE [Gardnerella vaginalis]PKZ18844.1 nucleotide exchange factor GrpE [Gardnerella vaginalis]RIY28708.1 nucleotide exchange factor GrpE [Bifidobacteriaceae bacterium GH005]
MSDFNANEYLQDMEDADSLDVKATGDSAKSSAQSSSKAAEGANPAETKADAKADANVSANSANSEDTANSTESSESKDSQDADSGSLTPLGKAKKEAAEYLEALQRERAEFINFRNRSAKEQDRFRQHGIIDVLTALLPALDDIDRIREHSEMDDSFKAVATKIDKAFEKFGVEKFGEKGEDFDPTKHDAILHRPDPDATKETVDAVVEAGYRIGDRVIRAARVVVSSPQQ